jgi:hypothetical protein
MDLDEFEEEFIFPVVSKHVSRTPDQASVDRHRVIMSLADAVFFIANIADGEPNPQMLESGS